MVVLVFAFLSKKSFKTWVCSVFHALSEKHNEKTLWARESAQLVHYLSIGGPYFGVPENNELVFSNIDVSLHSEQEHSKQLRVSAGFRRVQTCSLEFSCHHERYISKKRTSADPVCNFRFSFRLQDHVPRLPELFALCDCFAVQSVRETWTTTFTNKTTGRCLFSFKVGLTFKYRLILSNTEVLL